MKLLITVLLTLFSIAVEAQTELFLKLFQNLHTGEGSYSQMSAISDFSGWEFNEYCYAMANKPMQVGAGSSPSYSKGVFYTQSLGIYGNVTLLIETKNVESTEGAEFKVSIDGDDATSSVHTVVADNTNHRHSAILLCNCVPSSRIKIEGISGKFFVVSIKVFAIDDAIFYESFSYMKGYPKGAGHDEFDYKYQESGKATNANCDNSGVSVLNNIYQAKENVFIANKSGNISSYVINCIPVETELDALLTFKGARYDLNSNGEIILLCSGDTKLCTYGGITSSSKTETLSGECWKWNVFCVKLTNLNSSTTLTFAGHGVNLDEIKVTPIPANLDQSKNNYTYIIGNADQEVDVEIIRTLTPNIWCPLCLPFDVTKEMMEEATGKTCELCILNSIDNGVFKFDIATSTIPAGTPFLVRVAETVTNPEFKEVTIVNTPAATATASTENYQFVGTYSPVDLETDGTNLFLATDGALYKPTTDGNRLGGLRAYFVVPATSGAGARVMIPEIVSDIRSPRDVTPATKYEIYDLRGQRVSSPYSKGVFIHNGKRLLVP